MVLTNYIEEIVVSTTFHHQTNNKDPEYRNGKLEPEEGDASGGTESPRVNPGLGGGREEWGVNRKFLRSSAVSLEVISARLQNQPPRSRVTELGISVMEPAVIRLGSSSKVKGHRPPQHYLREPQQEEEESQKKGPEQEPQGVELRRSHERLPLKESKERRLDSAQPRALQAWEDP
ncbi:hypothetical protein CKAN_02003000 [Cinnamomum micranthum f. kanehirae]|uniref:DUF7751 domain-containing protein n=1 Tax=Cinnamomum micranthum f. kanehirae TaxID=337451 RepID=A0A3S3QUW0_9MAGN|nr:hypothetical protein CKAN_02003000 [Cinnamomum micranthum f. kanehirae]